MTQKIPTSFMDGPLVMAERSRWLHSCCRKDSAILQWDAGMKFFQASPRLLLHQFQRQNIVNLAVDYPF